MRKIAILNLKGGVGKTTTAVNLAAGLVGEGKRVLVVDLDPTCAATRWLGISDVNSADLLRVLKHGGDLGEIVRPSAWAGIDIIPASKDNLNAETYLKGDEMDLPVLWLEKRMQTLPGGKWDFVIFDCPPNLNVLTIGALAAVEELIIPVEASPLTLDGLVLMIERYRKARENLNVGLSITGILICRVEATREAEEIIGQLRGKFGDLVFDTVIRKNVKLTTSRRLQKSVFKHASTSHGADDYRALTKEVLARSAGRRGEGGAERRAAALTNAKAD